MARPMTEEYLEDTQTKFELAISRRVLPSWGWRDFKDSPALRRKVIEDLREKGGRARTVERLARFGKPALNLMEQCLEVANTTAHEVAQDFQGEGEISTAMISILAGNEVWLKWILKNNADPLWKDFGGRGVANYLFDPRYVNKIFEAEIIGEKDLTQAKITRWARGQSRCIEILRKHNKGQTWRMLTSYKDLNNKTVQEYIQDNLAKTNNSSWIRVLDEKGFSEFRRSLLSGHIMSTSSLTENKAVKPSI